MTYVENIMMSELQIMTKNLFNISVVVTCQNGQPFRALPTVHEVCRIEESHPFETEIAQGIHLDAKRMETMVSWLYITLIDGEKCIYFKGRKWFVLKCFNN